MKKVFASLAILIFASCIFAQVSIDAASRKTAERCLKLSENYLLDGDVNAAISQAELGIAYDDSISDLYYIKAAAEKMNGANVREVLELSKIANDKNNWVGYNEKGNRILYADLLSDTGNWIESLEVLDREPFVFSADAEAIRVKNYYRIGTDEYLSKARAKINSARRIYKGDVRFISLFFSFESAICIENGIDYEIEPQVLELADLLNAELKSYKEVSDELECLSMFFMEGEAKERALKAFAANGGADSFYPVVALKSGLLNQNDAFDLFYEFADESVPIEVLVYFASMITEDEVRQKLYEHLNAYSGTLYADLDDDMQGELVINYERGRPSEIHYDFDNDGYEDLYGTFDFGELLSVCVKPLGTEIYYSPYPWVSRAVRSADNITLNYMFAKNDAQISPIIFDMPIELQVENTENRFYVPYVKSNWANVDNLEFLQAATYAWGDSDERESSTVTYTLLGGEVISASYTENNVLYATADFSENLPTKRIVDYDGDGVFETAELFAPFKEKIADNFDASVKIRFPYYDFYNKVYLQAILKDMNNDNEPEFSEVYDEYGGVTTIFNREDGTYEKYIRYARKEGEPLIEESVFVLYDNDEIHVQTVDGNPSVVSMNDMEYEIFSGVTENFYWIGGEYETSAEIAVLAATYDVDQGAVILVESKDDFFRCIKVGKNIFAMKGETLVIVNPDLLDDEVEDVLEDEVSALFSEDEN